MKRIKGLFLILLIALFLVIPTNVNALSQQTNYIKVDDTTKSLTVGNLFFSNLTFKDYSSSSTQAFGITGTVANNSVEAINYLTTIYYYDLHYNIIARGYNSGMAITGTSNLNLMSNLSILNGHKTSEIKYYRLDINVLNSSTNKSNITSTTPSQNDKYSYYDYVIDKYDININVNENNTLDITETITAYFNVAKHGIYRTIPLNNTITRLDGSTSKNRTQLTNLNVDNEYKTYIEDGKYIIQIGSASHTVTGEQTYIIKYTYNLGKDPVKDYDELYYNIIGDEWDTVIGNITFVITMPKEFDSSKLGFSSGKKGSTDNSNVVYNVSENTISGSYDGILGKEEALTIRCELDEGYFVGAGFIINSNVYLMFIIPVLFLIISLLLWYKYGRDEQVIETVEFYPPEGFNSLEIGFLYKGKADNRDVTSLLVYLANKGYIKISEIEGKSLFSISKSFKITKLKEYDGDNANERLFLEGLFSSKIMKTINNEENKLIEVTSDDLYDNFYLTMKKILANINNKENKDKIFEKSTSGKSFIVILLMIISIMTTIAIPTMEYAGIKELRMTLFICAFYIPFFAVGIFAKIPLLFRVFWLGFTMFHSFSFFRSLPIAEAITNDPIYLFGFIIGIVCLIGIIICFKLMPKRTKYGNKMLGKLRGFKNFLETAEKDKLEAMVKQDPTYFYNILPYTYVLGVSDTWIKKFESISLQAPSWYDSPNAFDMMAFGTFMNTTMASAESVMASSPSSDSGGSSGGGSSGGGSGGGGGGSW